MPINPYRYKKVPVPTDIRKAVCDVVTDLGSEVRAARVIGIANCTMSELVHPGGVCKEATLAKVRAKLTELGKVA